VPGDWNSQREDLRYYEGTVWYRRAFEASPAEGRRQFLVFDAINYKAIVYLTTRELRPASSFPALEQHAGDVRVVDDPLGAELDVLGLNEYIGWYDGPPATSTAPAPNGGSHERRHLY
jgi:hypothetical protein